MKSLRARLLILTATLLAAGILVIDVATVVALRSYLTAQVDEQLEQAREPLVRRVGPIDNDHLAPPSSPRGGARGIGLSEFYIEIRRTDGTVETQIPSALRSEQYPTPNISTEMINEHANRSPFKVNTDDVDYRVAISSAPDRSGTIVIAAPVDRIEATIDRVIAIEVVATVAVLGVLMMVGWVVVRRDLLPLEDMAMTAGKIAEGDLSLRVDRSDAHSEVGQLGLAFNKMLNQIETSFDERTRSEARLRQFAADASHELRTPLTAVRGYAEMYRTGAVADSEHLDQVMSRIESEARRMGNVVEDLMLLARLDQGRPLANETVNIGDLVSACVRDARAIDASREFSYVAPGESIVVNGDSGRLTQILMNLLSNAIRHTPPGSPVEIRLFTEAKQAVVQVIDNGPGLSPEHANRVFERFYRLDEGRSRESGGSGLGLSIVDSLVRAHGGSVTVATQPAKGATFEVRLPSARTT